MALNSFSDVQAFFNDFIQANGVSIATARHGAFWQQVPGDVEASRDFFVNGNVPVVFNGNVKILVKGNGADSNIIHILKGEPPFGPALRMPLGGPFYSDAQIQELADWIDGLETDESDPVPDVFTMAPASVSCHRQADSSVQTSNDFDLPILWPPDIDVGNQPDGHVYTGSCASNGQEESVWYDPRINLNFVEYDKATRDRSRCQVMLRLAGTFS